MLYEIKITPLTKPQIRNLGKGKGVRVRAGNFPIQVDKSQYTRFHRNSRLGKAFTLKLTAKQGQGIFGDMFRYIKSNPVLRGAANAAIRGGKKYAHKGIDYLASKAHSKIDTFPMLGVGLRTRRRRGRGVGGLVLNGAAGLSNLIGGPGSREAADVLRGVGGVANFLGLGMKKKRGPRKGKGVFGGVMQGAAGLSNLIGGPGSGEAADVLRGVGGVANFLGLGMKKKRGTRKASPAQLKALAYGRAIRDANRSRSVSGSGRFLKKGYRGAALLPAGY
jgi:hypothetical protein